MKPLVYFFVLFLICSANAQENDRLRAIDSIKLNLKKLKPTDTVAIAGEQYKIAELYRKSLLIDSAYAYFQKAEKVFRAYNLKYEIAITLFGIAVVQCEEKDYTGSESTSFEALKILENLEEDNNVRQYRGYIYNNLGIVFNELEEYEESEKYYKIALKYKRSLEGDYARSIGLSENNLAFTYTNSGQYDLAIDLYKKILADKNIIENHTSVYVLALGNYAHTLYLSKNFKELPDLYYQALRVSDSIKDEYNSIIIHQRLSEYFNDMDQKESAKVHAYKAKELSESYNNDDLLKSLKVLSKVETGETASRYLREYITLSDSLHKAERATRDKYARIRFETDQIEAENIQIAKERRWLLIISIIVILAALLLYLFISQSVKNKELKFIQTQQESNEEIYNLMLSQNESIEEARTQEKKRISEELHDGVLGRLFGTRLSLDSLNMNNSIEAIQTRSQYISELKSIEDDIRKVSHELNADFISGSGFKDIINTLVETQAASYNLKYSLKHDDAVIWDEVSNKTKIHIYRIIQESLHNIYKHANATEVKISFKLKKNVICIDLTDNGSGFDVSKAKSGIGLKNMNSRVKDINGTINFVSIKDKGTTVTLEAPIG